MFLFSTFVVFVFGTIIGSFLNVLVIRGNTGRSIGGRSACMSCGTQLTARDLVPILSYLFLRGRCRSCASAISIQYPLVEFLAGALFVAAYVRAYSIAEFTLLAALCTVLLFVAVYDMRHTIIPDTSIALLVVLAGVSFVLHMHSTALSAYLVAAIIAGAPLFLLWYFSSGSAMGFGDVKLASALGLFLYPLQSLAFLWLAFVTGGAAALLLLGAPKVLMHTPSLRQRLPLVTIKSEIPFGPFLIAGFFGVLFFGIDTLSILEWFTL